MTQSATFTTHTLNFDYDYWTSGGCKNFAWIVCPTEPGVDDIFSSVLPEELVEGSPTGFAIVGHIGDSSVVHF